LLSAALLAGIVTGLTGFGLALIDQHAYFALCLRAAYGSRADGRFLYPERVNPGWIKATGIRFFLLKPETCSMMPSPE
jgi:hypothetical protein